MDCTWGTPKSSKRRSDRWYWFSTDLLATDRHPFLVHRYPGRLRLHVESSFRRRQNDVDDRPKRQVLLAINVLVRMRRTRHYGNANDRKCEGSDGHHSDRSTDELFREVACLYSSGICVCPGCNLPRRMAISSRGRPIRHALRRRIGSDSYRMVFA